MKKIIVVAGPTAVGKTEYAIEIAKEFNGEIVSCDSMQLYKYMDIGSAKPTIEERAIVKHYLIDEIHPKEEFSVVDYQKRSKAAIDEIFSKGKTPIIAGGTGLYLNALLFDMDFGETKANHEYRNALYNIAETQGNEALHKLLKDKSEEIAERIHFNNVKRVVRALEAIELKGEELKPFENVKNRTTEYETCLICLTRNREELYDRINRRVDILLDQGLLEEVKGLIDMGFTSSDISMKGIGYKEIISFYNNEITLDEAIELVKRNSRRYAKRQLTWFKRYDDMKWFNLSEVGLKEVLSWLKINI
ncbi:MAG: tRNA (adenosine(37)-N6)-dimethylallyltransferase MiaA [Anaerovoracaceae bacterium]